MEQPINKSHTAIFDDVVRQKHRSTFYSLPLRLQKQLIIDIVKTGDRRTAKIREICNQRPHLYGPPGSKQRKRIQNKVYWWKKYDDSEFNNLFIWLTNLPDSVPQQLPSPDTALSENKQPTTKSNMSKFESHPPHSISGSVATSTVGAPYGSTDFSDCGK